MSLREVREDMSYQDLVKKLSEQIDGETIALLPTSGKLLLLGSEDSVFLKSIKRKADSLGIQYDHTFHFTPPYQGAVVDTETCPSDLQLSSDVDIDHSFSDGLSSVSQGVLALLLAADLVHKKNITIVGRGHAVKGLAQALIYNNATVTVAHSKTTSLLQATQNRDVVIYATPNVAQDISYNTGELVIDLGNAVPHPDRLSCEYINRIGQLTVSILLNRFVRQSKQKP